MQICLYSKTPRTVARLSVSRGKVTIHEAYGETGWLKELLARYLSDGVTHLAERRSNNNVDYVEESITHESPLFIDVLKNKLHGFCSNVAIFPEPHARAWTLAHVFPFDDVIIRDSVYASIPNLDTEHAAQMADQLAAALEELRQLEAERKSVLTTRKEKELEVLAEMEEELGK